MSKLLRNGHPRTAKATAPAAEPGDDLDGDFSLTCHDMLASAESFAEPLDGLQTRELRGQAMFRHFFGGAMLG